MKTKNYFLNHSRILTLVALAILTAKLSPLVSAQNNSNTVAAVQPGQTNAVQNARRAGRSAAVGVAAISTAEF
jgi:hypothetical protein